MALTPWFILLLERLLQGIARKSFSDESTIQCEKNTVKLSTKLVAFHNRKIKVSEVRLSLQYLLLGLKVHSF